MMVASGLLHATVNALFKSGGADKLAGRALIDGASAFIVLPVTLVVPLPHGAWIWLGGSMATHVIYLACLVRAFAMADMSAVYPVMRGSAPVLAALASVAVLGDHVTAPIATGIALVCLGTLLVALRHAPPLPALGWALGTGAAGALFTVVDARGVRAAPTAISYIVWDFLLTGGSIAIALLMVRRRVLIAAFRQQWRVGVGAGSLSIVSYGLALGAFRLGSVARLAALREVSIVFALVIAVVALKERVRPLRAAGAALIAAGAAVLVTLG